MNEIIRCTEIHDHADSILSFAQEEEASYARIGVTLKLWLLFVRRCRILQAWEGCTPEARGDDLAVIQPWKYECMDKGF